MRWFGRDGGGALYAAIVAEARDPAWYRAYGVADTVDGRFDMLALVLALVMLRLEREGQSRETLRLTEAFVADMEGQLREQGIGDPTVGRRVTALTAALGGRVGAYRTGDRRAALRRNLYRGGADEAVLAAAVDAVTALAARIEAASFDDLRSGNIA